MPSLIDKSGNLRYFGRLSWGNFVDWWVTFCLGAILALNTLALGGVRPETQLLILPLYGVLIVLHGLWLAVNRDDSTKRISYVPLAFLPFVLWMGLSAHWITATPWLGSYVWIACLQAFVVFWVLVNNLRTRGHLTVLLLCVLAPAARVVFMGFYQFFQKPSLFADALAGYSLRMDPVFLGHATGSFGDPNTYASYLLVIMVAMAVIAIVPRLPVIVRLLAFYLSLMLLLGAFFAQVLWAAIPLVLAFFLVPWFSFRRRRTAFLAGVTGNLLFFGLLVSIYFFYPRLQNLMSDALSADGEAVRLKLWAEALDGFVASPVWGQGAGSFPLHMAQSGTRAFSGVASSPENDYLLLLSEYGLIGAVLLLVPLVIVIVRAYRRWRKEDYEVSFRDRKGRTMPPQRYFLSFGLCGLLVLLTCAGFHFVAMVPALCLTAVVALAVVVKIRFSRNLQIPGSLWARWGYLVLSLVLGLLFLRYSQPRLASQGEALLAEQRLEQLVRARVHLSGNDALLDETLARFQTATELNPQNVDAWIGLSSAYCQLFFRNPASYSIDAEPAVQAARQAVEACDVYWESWAQLGIALGFAGDADGARDALLRALELAPLNSNANYFWAAYLGHFPEEMEAARSSVDRALEIDPDNEAARRLQQKLRIL
ncbi:O-antigen ligase family protein [Coraliomargarita parva]|uniref:O-antigen ligase family protein n=1 Tax=Coraliomargarita parva TaxID=3014050 RepID=UPI0022B34A2A|nr:O-antigen ligase family protein [Coraliomargarita parva]